MPRNIKYTLEEFATIEHLYRDAYKAFQEAKDEAEIIKESAKDVLSRLMNEIDAGNDGKKASAVELERQARASAEWNKFREGQWAAIRAEGQARIKATTTKTAWDTCQSGLSYKKAELQKLSG